MNLTPCSDEADETGQYDGPRSECTPRELTATCFQRTIIVTSLHGHTAQDQASKPTFDRPCRSVCWWSGRRGFTNDASLSGN